jgi:hypothetical protein
MSTFSRYYSFFLPNARFSASSMPWREKKKQSFFMACKRNHPIATPGTRRFWGHKMFWQT